MRMLIVQLRKLFGLLALGFGQYGIVHLIFGEFALSDQLSELEEIDCVFARDFSCVEGLESYEGLIIHVDR